MSANQEPVPMPEPLTDAELDAVSGGTTIPGVRTNSIKDGTSHILDGTSHILDGTSHILDGTSHIAGRTGVR